MLWRRIEQREGVDVSNGGKNNLSPTNEVDKNKCQGNAGGFKKELTIDDMIFIAYRMEEKPNIIVRAGQEGKAQWYLKKVDIEEIEEKIEKQTLSSRGRNNKLKHYLMYIIKWK